VQNRKCTRLAGTRRALPIMRLAAPRRARKNRTGRPRGEPRGSRTRLPKRQVKLPIRFETKRSSRLTRDQKREEATLALRADSHPSTSFPPLSQGHFQSAGGLAQAQDSLGSTLLRHLPRTERRPHTSGHCVRKSRNAPRSDYSGRRGGGGRVGWFRWCRGAARFIDQPRGAFRP
jgi:hypothetical protein